MLAGGIYMPDSDTLKLLRQEVFYNITEFKKIINEKNFKQLFGMIEGDKLVNAPKGFPDDFKEMDLLKYKSYSMVHGISEKILFSEKACEYSLGVFKAMLPLNKFLNRARFSAQ
jgi:uncharacterized protein (TIGR02453 family)